MRLTPATELEHRYKKLQHYMAEQGLDAVIILQNADLFYFTGTIQSGNLYVPVEGEPVYMVRKDFMRARMECGLKHVVAFSSMKDIPSVLSEYGYQLPVNIGMELDAIPVNFFSRYQKVFPVGRFSDATPLIRKVRMIKTHYEIHLLQDAAQQVDKINSRVRDVLREGMTDLELAAELEYVARKEGHQGLVRMRAFNGVMLFGHVFSGTDTAVPTYVDTPLGGMGINTSFSQGAGYKRIEKNEPVIVDFAGCCDGYLVDQTRIFSIGDLSDKMKKGYDDMLKVQNLMTELVPQRPSWGSIYDECLVLARKLGYADTFMGNKGAQVSFIGHGLGIEIDEYPFIAKGFNDVIMESGMAFAFEPKVVFAGEGAVGIENTFYLTDTGLKRLTFSSEELVVL